MAHALTYSAVHQLKQNVGMTLRIQWAPAGKVFAWQYGSGLGQNLPSFFVVVQPVPELRDRFLDRSGSEVAFAYRCTRRQVRCDREGIAEATGPCDRHGASRQSPVFRTSKLDALRHMNLKDGGEDRMNCPRRDGQCITHMRMS